MEKFVLGLENEIKREDLSNKNKVRKIEILKKEHDQMNYNI